MIYRYDGSFSGFLCAVYEAYHDGTSRTEGICAGEDATGLFSEEKRVFDCPDHARTVASAFREQCGRPAFQWLYRAFLAEEEGREDALFLYIRRGFRLRKAIYSHRTEKWAWQVFQWAQMTGAEAGKFLGLVRFSELGEGLLYAEIEPSHDILPVIAPHFTKRLAAEKWAIHDVRRKKAVLWEGKRLLFGEVPEAAAVSYSEREEGFRRLWRTYYRHMAIPERVNPELRRSFMPEKYWGHLTEMQKENLQKFYK